MMARGRRAHLKLRKVKVGQGALYVGTPVSFEEKTYVACPHGDVLCFDRQSITLQWRVPSEDLSIALVHEGVLVLENGVQVRGLSTADGRLLWTIPRPQSPSGDWCQLWLEGNRVHLVPQGGEEERIVDVRSGASVETRPPSFPFGLISRGTIVEQGSLRIFWDRSRDVQGVWDTARSRLLWERSLYAEMGESCGEAWPRVGERMTAADDAPVKQVGTIRNAFGDAEVAVVRYGHFLFGYSLAKGEILWHAGPLGVHLAKPVIADGRVYAVVIQQDPEPASNLLALDLETGRGVYDVRLGGVEAVESNPAVLTEDAMAWTFRHVGRMLLVRRSDGKVLWTQRYKAEVGMPLVDRDRLIFPAYDASLLVYEGLSQLGA